MATGEGREGYQGAKTKTSKQIWQDELARVKEILASPATSDQQKDQARLYAVGQTLDYYERESPGLKNSMLLTAQGKSTLDAPKIDALKKQHVSSKLVADDLRGQDEYFIQGGGPEKLKTPDEIKRDIQLIADSTSTLRDLGIHKNNDRASEEVRAASGIFKGQIDKMMQYGDYLKTAMPKDAKGNIMDSPDPTINSLARGFNEGKARADFREAVDPMVQNVKNQTDHHDNSRWEGIRDGAKRTAIVAAFAGGAALAGQASAAAQAAQATQAANAAVPAAASATTSAAELGGIAQASMTPAELSAAGLSSSSGLAPAAAATTGVSGLYPSLTAAAANPLVQLAVPVATAGANAIIQNEANKDAQNVQREMSTNAIQAAERANSDSQRITEQNRVRSVGAIEGYNKDARDTLSAGYADISKLYEDQQATQRGMINTGVAGARGDLTQGYSQAEQALGTGTQDARTALLGSSAQAQGTLSGAYDRARSDLQAGYGGAERDIRAGYSTADQRLQTSQDNQLGTLGNMYNTSVNRLDPYMKTGTDALGNIKTGVDLGDAAYKFRLKDQTDQINAKLAAQGLNGSGRAASILGEQTARLTADEARRQFENNMQLANLGYGATTQANQLSQGYGRDAAGVFDVTGRSMAANAIGQGQNLSDIGMRRTDQGNTLGLSYSGSIADLQAGTGRDVANLSTQDSARLADLYAKRGGDLAQNTQYGLQMGLQNEQLYGDKLAAAKSDVYGGTANLYSRTGSDIANINTGAAAQGVQANLTMGSNIAGTYRDQGSNLADLYGAQGANWSNALGTAANGYNEYQNRQANQKRFDDYVALQDKWASLYGRPVS